MKKMFKRFLLCRYIIALNLILLSSTAYASNERDLPSLLDTFSVTTSIPINGHNYITSSPDGTKLYAAGVINRKASFSIIDTATNTIEETIALGYGLYILDIEITPDGTEVYIPVARYGSGPSRIEVYDTIAKQFLPPILTGGSRLGPSSVAFTPDGQWAYVSHHGSSRVYAIETETHSIYTTINNLYEPVGLSVTPDGTRLYVAGRRNSIVYVVNTANNTVIDKIYVSVVPSASTTKVAITPDGNRAYVTTNRDSRISVIDTDPNSPTYNTEINVISTTGGYLRDIDITQDGRLLFVASPTNETLIISIDPNALDYHTQVGAISNTGSPIGIELVSTCMTVGYVISHSPNGAIDVIGYNGNPSCGSCGSVLSTPEELSNIVDEMLASGEIAGPGKSAQGVANDRKAILGEATNALSQPVADYYFVISKLYEFIDMVSAQTCDPEQGNGQCNGKKISTEAGAELICHAEGLIEKYSDMLFN